MFDRLENQIVIGCKRLSSIVSALVAFTAAVGLIAWATGLPIFKPVLANSVLFKPRTAVMLLMASASLLILGSSKGRTSKIVARVGLVACIFSALTALIQYQFKASFGDGASLRIELTPEAQTNVPSPITAASIVLISIAAILCSMRKAITFAQALCLVSMLFGMLVLTGYAYGVEYLRDMSLSVDIATHSAVAVVLLSIATLLYIPDNGFMVAVSNSTAAGMMLRRLLPVVILVPLVLGWVRLFGERMAYYDFATGTTLFAWSNVLVLTITVCWTVNLLNRSIARAARAEETASQNAARLRAILHTSVEGIMTTDNSGRIFSFNPAMSKIFGYSAEEVLDRNVSLLFPAEARTDIAVLDSILLKQSADSTSKAQEITGRRKNQENVYLDVTISRSSFGNRSIFTWIGRDITERKRAEIALARRTEELGRSNVELERFAYVASHDLQEPMRTVRSFAQLLQRRYGELLKGDAAEYLRFITEGVHRMQALINDLLAYSRVSSQRLPFRRVDVAEVCQRVISDLQAAITMQGATVTIDSLPVVEGDATQLGQLYQNLVSNAIKFRGSQPPQIHISAQDQGAGWVFSVADNGIGIPSQHFERIFDIFQRLHTVDEYAGTGVGLAICKKIVERHHGRIWVESTVGEGTTFHFTLPKRRERHDSEQERSVVGRGQSSRHSVGEGSVR